MRPGHWLILAAILGAGVVIERASSKLEHALIVSAYYQATEPWGTNRLPLPVVFPGRSYEDGEADQ